MKSDIGSDCGYYIYRITFEGNAKKEISYPAGDNCDTALNDNGKFFCMGDVNKDMLASLLSKYDIPMPSSTN